MNHLRSTVFALLAALALGASACSGPDCVSLCEEAQSRDCTAIEGDCSSFCSSLEKVSDAAGCNSQKDAYQSCLEEDDICTGESRCSSQQNALGTCGGAYCLANSNNADCQRVVNSF